MAKLTAALGLLVALGCSSSPSSELSSQAGAAGTSGSGGGESGAAGESGAGGSATDSGVLTPGCGHVDDAASPYAYFDALRSRPDCFAAYGLRDAEQVRALYPNPAGDIAYVYPDDPDSRRQDAARIRIRQGSISPEGNMNVPIGPTLGKSLLFTFDYWLGAEWNADYSHINGHKNGAPFGFGIAGFEGTWFTNQTNYRNALMHLHNQPPGGPFVAMPFPHLNVGNRVKAPFWRDGQSGFPRADLPYGAASKETRGYTEAIQPFDTETYSEGQEFGLVAERWHRFWHYFERAPDEDWSDPTITTGPDMAAYRWSFWFADSVRGVVRMLSGAIVGIPIESDGFVLARMIYGKGGIEDDALTIVRADLIGYVRNIIVLHGTSHGDVLALLQPPAD